LDRRRQRLSRRAHRRSTNTPRLGQQAKAFDGAFHDRCEVVRPERKRVELPFGAREPQHVLDEMNQPLRFAGDDIHTPLLGFGRLVPAHAHRVGE
jgi:hypothetical protein